MSELIVLNAQRPDRRDLQRIVAAMKSGAIVAYPTDSGYSLGCAMGAKKAIARISQIRQLEPKHNYTLICRDLSEIAHYARVDTASYRIMKRCAPGPFTFILPASGEVPKLLKNKSKKTIGIRVPDHPIAHAIAEEEGESFMSSSLILPGESEPLIYAEDVAEALDNQIEIIIDGGYCGLEPTTVIDLSTKFPTILRRGLGDADWLEQK